MKRTIGQRRRALGLILSQSRINHGKTQEYMAQELGVSRNTIANWERGTSGKISFFEIEDWIDVLGENPFYMLRNYLAPEMYISKEQDPSTKESLIKYISENASDTIISQLAFLFLGEHGSDSDAVMQELTALLQLPLSIRYPIATHIRSCYSMVDALQDFKCPSCPKPNLEIWDRAIEAGKDAGIKNKSSYSIKKEHAE